MSDRQLTIILVRHGLDQGQVRKQFIDGELTVEGVHQISKIRQTLASNTITRLYSSSMKRSQQSAAILLEGLSVTITTDERIHPRDLGQANGLSYRDVQSKYEKLLMQSTYTMDFRFPDGESNADVFRRTGDFLKDLLRTAQGVRETIIIISSALVLNYLIYHLQNIGFREGLLYVFEYGQHAVFESQDNYFQLKVFK